MNALWDHMGCFFFAVRFWDPKWKVQFPFVDFPFCGMTPVGWNQALGKKHFCRIRKSVFFVHACTASSPLKINIVLLQQHDIEPSGGSCLKSANPTSTLTSLNLLTPPRYLVWPRSKLRRWNDHWSLSTHLVVHNSPWKSCLMTTFIARVDTPKIFHQHITWDNCFNSISIPAMWYPLLLIKLVILPLSPLCPPLSGKIKCWISNCTRRAPARCCQSRPAVAYDIQKPARGVSMQGFVWAPPHLFGFGSVIYMFMYIKWIYINHTHIQICKYKYVTFMVSGASFMAVGPKQFGKKPNQPQSHQLPLATAGHRTARSRLWLRRPACWLGTLLNIIRFYKGLFGNMLG